MILLGASLHVCACEKKPEIYPVRRDIVETVYASGRLISKNEYILTSLSSGRIEKKLINDGDSVKKGQLLFVISNPAARERFNAALLNYRTTALNRSDNSPLLKDLQITLENASVKCTNDSATFHRYKNLWDRGIGTKNNLDQAYLNYQLSVNQKRIAEQKYRSTIADLHVMESNAKSAMSLAGKELNDFFIRSDRDGIAYQTFKEEGESIFAGEKAALIGDCAEQTIRLAVDQQDIGRIKAGQRVLLQSDVSGDRIYEAVVTTVYPVMNELDQTFRVDADFIQTDASSFIHNSVEANIIIQKKLKSLVLPRTAVGINDSVWIRQKGDKKKIKIERGITTLDYVEVISGINEHTPVLVIKENEAP